MPRHENTRTPNKKQLTKMKEIEEMEYKYLNKYYYFLKYAEDEMMIGFQTKEEIKKDRIGKYGGDNGGISDFSTGAERIVYALLNGKGVGQPNSAPVGSDLFFEVQDAYIHIDLKTVQTSTNLNDILDIFVGVNQNSYKSEIEVTRGENKGKFRKYIPALPPFYNKGTKKEKICLTYFVTILYEPVNLDIYNINILCMPNGDLEPYYGTRVLKPGKNPDKTRFAFTKTPKFELLENQPYRAKVIYLNPNMPENVRKKLKLYESIYNLQTESVC